MVQTNKNSLVSGLNQDYRFKKGMERKNSLILLKSRENISTDKSKQK